MPQADQPGSFSWSTMSPDHRRILLYASLTFTIAFSDALMSYLAPVYVQSKVNNPTVMGLILSTSSVFGIATDVIFGERFKHKPFYFFLYLAFILAALFPLLLFGGPPLVLVFLASMAIWGMYFELIGFSNFRFIAEAIHPAHYSWAWSVLSIFKAIALASTPFLASFIFHSGSLRAYAWLLLAYPVALIVFTVSRRNYREHHLQPVAMERFGFRQELQTWRLLLTRMWPLAIFAVTLVLVDSTFWTIGTLLSEQQRSIAPAGTILLLYNLPTLFVGLFTPKLGRIWGKKRMAFITAFVSGLLLVAFGLTPATILMFGFVFATSLLLSITWPLRAAVFEDYVGRMKHRSTNLIALTGAMDGSAYVIGPIINGLIASRVGNQLTFAVTGGLLALVSLFALFLVPRKIRLPQKELEQIN